MNMLIFFIIFFEMAVLYFAEHRRCSTRGLAAPKLAWFALRAHGRRRDPGRVR